MEITSDVYGGSGGGDRTSMFNKHSNFCTIILREGASKLDGIINEFKIRFNTERPNDLLLLQQLRSDIEKAIKFIINS